MIVEGRGTKRASAASSLPTRCCAWRASAGITMYEHDELVFTARAGTPLAEIEESLAANGQCLGFEPGDVAKIWGAEERATIGGTVAAGIAGPRRFAAGGARDHLLGFRRSTAKANASKPAAAS